MEDFQLSAMQGSDSFLIILTKVKQKIIYRS